MKIPFLILSPFFLALFFTIQVEKPTKPLLPEAYFNFWLGEWNLSWYHADSSKSTGYNRIVKILDGNVIQENFVSFSKKEEIPLKGMSLSVYNPRTSEWHQTWTDNQGSYLDFKGRLEGEDRIFSTTRHKAEGTKVLLRMVFTDIQQDSFTWNWEASEDEGKNWQLLWQIFYQRKKGGS